MNENSFFIYTIMTLINSFCDSSFEQLYTYSSYKDILFSFEFVNIVDIINKFYFHTDLLKQNQEWFWLTVS